jgi:hypothetical protein
VKCAGPFERWREGRGKTKEKPKAREGQPDMSGVLPMQLCQKERGGSRLVNPVTKVIKGELYCPV